MKFRKQPPQSPQFNALDCGIFNSIQSKVYKAKAQSIEALINNVVETYNNMSWTTIENTFLSVQGCMEDALSVAENNSVKMRHMNKDELRHEHRLAESLKVQPSLIAAGREIIDSKNWLHQQEAILAERRCFREEQITLDIMKQINAIDSDGSSAYDPEFRDDDSVSDSSMGIFDSDDMLVGVSDNEMGDRIE